MRTPIHERFEQHVDRITTPDGCHLWTAGCDRQGYGQFAVDHGGVRWRTEVASRVAWELYTGKPPPPEMLVCHTCDNPPCQRREHLFLGTASDNAKDRETKDRGYIRYLPDEVRARGSRHGRAKLTEQQARAIRAAYSDGALTQQELADMYGVNQSKISDLVRGRTWRHVLEVG